MGASGNPDCAVTGKMAPSRFCCLLRAMTKRTVIKTDLFADEHHQKKITTLDDPLAETASSTDLTAGATEVDDLAPRRVCPQGGCPLCLTETMARILALKRLHHLPPGEQMTYQLPERMSRERFRGLPHGASRASNQ